MRTACVCLCVCVCDCARRENRRNKQERNKTNEARLTAVLLVLANNEHVNVLVEGRDKRVEGDDWADVGVEAEGLADSDVERLDATTKWGCDGRLEEEAGALEAIPAILINTRGDTPLVHVLADLNHLGLDLCAGGIEDLEGRLHNLPGMYCCVFGGARRGGEDRMVGVQV